MSPGTRAVHGGIAAISHFVPKPWVSPQPLLFLYPQWIRTTATAARSSGGDVSRSPTSGFENRTTIFGQNATESNLQIRDHEPASANDISHRLLTKPTEVAPPSKNVHQQTILPEADETRIPSSSRRKLSAKRKNATGGYKYGSFENGGQIRKIMEVMEKHSLKKDYNRTAVEFYQKQKRSERGTALPNWRTILRDLDLYTPVHSGKWHSHALKILVPADAVKELIFGMNDNIWEVKKRTTCHIELSSADADVDAGYRTLLLSGSVKSISQATAEVFRLAPGSICNTTVQDRKPPTFNTDSVLEPDLNRRSLVLRIRSEPHKSLSIPKRPDLIEKPTNWTAATFATYVQSLTSMKVSSHVHMLLYESKNTHIHMVLYLLEQLFFDPEAKDAISVTAFNDAITYMMRNNQVKLARQLFVRMEMLDLPVNTESFNIMLRGCAKSNDLGTFQFLLRMMLHRGYTPDARTWLALIQTVKNQEIKQYVVDCMKKKDLFSNPAIRKEACEQLVIVDIQQSLREGMSHDEFLHHMSDRYSKDWLNVGSASRILRVLASHGLVSRCWDFVQYMHSQNVEPNTMCYNSILGLCHKLENVEGALEIFSLMASLKMPLVHDSTYEVLFDMAWKSRSYNLTLVLWRYACMDKATTFKMRKRVQDVIISAPRPQNDVWGTRLFTHSRPRPVGMLVSDPPKQATSSESPFAYHNTAIFNTSIGDQIRQAWPWKPTRPLPQMLLAALAVDREFISSGARDLPEEQSLAWLKEHAVEIPLQSRRRLAENEEVQAWW